MTAEGNPRSVKGWAVYVFALMLVGLALLSYSLAELSLRHGWRPLAAGVAAFVAACGWVATLFRSAGRGTRRVIARRYAVWVPVLAVVTGAILQSALSGRPWLSGAILGMLIGLLGSFVILIGWAWRRTLVR